MADIQPNPDPNRSIYWCYHCEKRVEVETRPDIADVICLDCNNGFVEPLSSDPQFLEVLRRLADSPPDPNQNPSSFNSDVEEERENHDDEDEERRSRLVVEAIRRTLMGEDEEGLGFATGQERILNWAEILMELEDDHLEATYMGNPADYVDAAGFEALLQNLVETDNGGRIGGAPPAAKSAVEGLDTVVVGNEGEVFFCAVCKDLVAVGENAKKLGCGHLYHGDCIVPWLGTRNSCPICRFELPTDDPEYEEERKRKGEQGKGGPSSGVGVGAR